MGAHPGIFERIEQLGGRSVFAAWILAWSATVALHGGGAGLAAARLIEIEDFATEIRQVARGRWDTTIDVETDPEPEPEPEPEAPPEPEPERAEPEPQPVEPTTIRAPVDERIEPTETADAAPEAAQAGQVLTSDPDPNEPLDLTDQGFITGTGTRYSGGISSSKGTSKTAVRNPAARSGGVPGGKGTTPGGVQAPIVDRSRPAGIPRNANWKSCPFPAEADAEQIHNANVLIAVLVSTSGKPKSVSVLSDPGHGFAREVKKCAMRFRFEVGLDKWGQPTESTTPPFRVKFER
jgi:protein TonB